MEKFTIFDILSFILPGTLCIQFIDWLMIRAGYQVPAELIMSNNLLSAVVLIFIVYLLGLLLNHLRLNFKFFWARKPTSYLEPLQAESPWLNVLDRTSRRYFGEQLLNEEKNPIPAIADRLFDLSFEILHQEGQANRTSSIRLQAFFLENTKTLLIFIMVIWAILSLGNILGFSGEIWGETSIIGDITGTLGAGVLAYGCHVIARQRWRQFYYSMWQNFYAYHLKTEIFLKSNTKS